MPPPTWRLRCNSRSHRPQCAPPAACTGPGDFRTHSEACRGRAAGLLAWVRAHACQFACMQAGSPFPSGSAGSPGRRWRCRTSTRHTRLCRSMGHPPPPRRLRCRSHGPLYTRPQPPATTRPRCQSSASNGCKEEGWPAVHSGRSEDGWSDQDGPRSTSKCKRVGAGVFHRCAVLTFGKQH